MTMNSLVRKIVTCVIAGLAVRGAAIAQEVFPSRPITLISGYAAGGTSDTSIRYLADSMSKRLGQPVVVLNKVGAGGVVSLTELKRAKSDGYTIGFLATGPIITSHMQELPFDPINDFTPIALVSRAIYGFAVRADSEFKTMKDVIAYAAANPGKVSYSTVGIGSPQHLVMVQLAEKAKIDIVHVPTSGGLPAVTMMLGGHVTGTSQTTEWKPYVESGRARLLALYTAHRIPEYPEVPTLVELGYDIVAPSVYAIVGPADMPQPIVAKLYEALNAAMHEPGYIALLKKLDLQPDFSDPEGLRKLIVSVSDQAAEALKNVPKEK